MNSSGRFQPNAATWSLIADIASAVATVVAAVALILSFIAYRESAETQRKQTELAAETQRRDDELAQRQLESEARKYADDLTFDTYNRRAKDGSIMATEVTVKNFSPRPLNDMRFETLEKDSSGKSAPTIIPLRTVPTCWRVTFVVLGRWWTSDTYIVFADINGAYWQRKEDKPATASSRAAKDAHVYEKALQGKTVTTNGAKRLIWTGRHATLGKCGG
jgi:hypothetical protein